MDYVEVVKVSDCVCTVLGGKYVFRCVYRDRFYKLATSCLSEWEMLKNVRLIKQSLFFLTIESHFPKLGVPTADTPLKISNWSILVEIVHREV